MGAGNRFKSGKANSFGIGFFYTDFPFSNTFTFYIAFWYITIGLGKAYHD